MRLECVDHDHKLAQKIKLGLIRLVSGHPAPGVVKTLFFRKHFFGDPMSELTQEVMRGPSDLSVGERELIASFVSRLHQCEF